MSQPTNSTDQFWRHEKCANIRAYIYRSELLPTSETFIKAQAGALTRFRHQFVGLGRVRLGLSVGQDAITLTRGTSFLARVRRRLYKELAIAPRFHKQIAAAGGSLVHAHFASDGAVISPLCRNLKLPLIVTLHGYDVSVRCDFKKRYERLWADAALFICVSEFIRQKALAAGFPDQKLLVHYIGVDSSQFIPNAAPPEDGLVLFVGRLVEKKGCEYAINAMQTLQQRIDTARLVVIGDGPLKSSLQDLARQQGVRCEFLGAQPSHVIRDWLGRASLFCAPSVTAPNGDSEGLGIVFLEAQAMQVPIVSFQHGGIPEAVAHGETGLLAPEGNHEVLAQHILTFLTDKAFREKCGTAGRERVQRLFNLQTQTAILERIYEQVLAGGKVDGRDHFSDSANLAA